MLRRGRAAASAMLFLTTACYQYIPVSVSPRPAVGRKVRVRVTSDGARLLQLDGAVQDARSVSGTVVESDSAAIVVRVAVRDPTATTFRDRDLHQRIRIPIRDVEEIDSRKIDGARTGLFAGLGLAGFLSLLFLGGGGTVGGNTAPPPPEKP